MDKVTRKEINMLGLLDKRLPIDMILTDLCCDPFFGGRDRNHRFEADLVETDEAYVLTANVPGAEKEAIEVSLDSGILTVTYNLHEEKETHNDVILKERCMGYFSRSFRIGEDVDAESISASLKNGILTVTANKSEQAKPKKIEIA